MRNYIALIHKDSDSDYGVSFPDLPGVISAGATLDEARQMGAEALAQNWDAVAALIPVAEGPPRAVDKERAICPESSSSTRLSRAASPFRAQRETFPAVRFALSRGRPE